MDARYSFSPANGPFAQFGNASYNNSNTSNTSTPRPGAQSDSKTGPPRYQPPQRRSLGRDESVSRTDSNTSSSAPFATRPPMYQPQPMYQSTYGPPPTRPNINGRPPYLGQVPSRNGSDVDVNGLGAGLANMRVNGGSERGGSGGKDANGRRRDSKQSSSSSSPQDSVMTTSTPPSSSASARWLADQIRSGTTEDPYDRTLNRYDTAPKPTNPVLGPARFKDSKMFSTAEGTPDISTAADPNPLAVKTLTPTPNPDWLELAQNSLMTPNMEEACSSLPLTELGRQISAPTAGVVRIKDIPYQTTKQEMVAFVGRNAQILRQPEGSPYHAVHILMERETGKTMDCFIEFSTPQEAAWVARQFQRRVDTNRIPKVGDRNVEVSYSSQDELMAELFPRAKHVRWSGGQPRVDTATRQYYPHQAAAGFKGFMHPEEFVMLAKHANLNDRSPFASKSPCRVYESMVSTLYKYPWYAVKYITVRERRGIYDCVCTLMRILIENLRRSSNRYSPLDPTPALLQELVIATLSCPGFSEKQKATVIRQLNLHGYTAIARGHAVNVPLGGHYEMSKFWPFAALSPIPGTDAALIKYFAGLFRKASKSSSSLASRKESQAQGYDDKPMGEWKISYDNNADELTLAQVAKAEYNKVEEMLRKVCNVPGRRPSDESNYNGSNGSKSSSSGTYSYSGSW